MDYMIRLYININRYGFQISFYKDVEEIFKELKENNVYIVAASRTSAPGMYSISHLLIVY